MNEHTENGVPKTYVLRMNGPETWILRPGGVGLVRPGMTVAAACHATVDELNGLLSRALKAEAELAELRGAVDPKLVARFEGYLDMVLGEMQPTSPRREAAERCRAMFATITAMAQKAAADAYTHHAKPEPENENDLADAILAAARETFGEERVNRNPRASFWLGALCAPWSTLDEKGPKP